MFTASIGWHGWLRCAMALKRSLAKRPQAGRLDRRAPGAGPGDHPTADAAETAGGAVHYTAAAPARTIIIRCRPIGSPQHVPPRPVR
jgi:hypothetical protein